MVEGQLFLDDVPALKLGVGAVEGRWAWYSIYRFTPRDDGSVPKMMAFRRLLARTRSADDRDRESFIATIFSDPSAWGLYEFTVAVEEHIIKQIPDEILDSPNLKMRPPLESVIKGIHRQCQARSSEEAEAFLTNQAPRIQDMLR